METCHNCGASVDLLVFELHEAHCSRFLIKCSCDQVVRVLDESTHYQQFHSQQSCSLCGETFENWQKPLHDCSVRLEKCETCELFMIKEQLDEHLEVCLMRTRQCVDCKQFIRVKEFKEHLVKECMPKICERQGGTGKGKRSRGGRKKKEWVCVRYERKKEILEDRGEEFDRQVAENLLEEIIFSDLAEEENYGFM